MVVGVMVVIEATEVAVVVTEDTGAAGDMVTMAVMGVEGTEVTAVVVATAVNEMMGITKKLHKWKNKNTQ